MTEKHLHLLVNMKSEELIVNELDKSILFLNDFKGPLIKRLTLSKSLSNTHESPLSLIHPPINRFIKSLSNLVVFRTVNLCNDDMVQLLAECCPSLEELNLRYTPNVSDLGMVALCGFDRYIDQDALKDCSGTGRERGCRSLKKILLSDTNVSNLGVVYLLQYCKGLELINATPNVQMDVVFEMLYGTDPALYSEVRRRYSLHSLIIDPSSLTDPHVLSLITVACPRVKSVQIPFSGVERKDKNTFANLLNLHLTHVYFINAHPGALLWYLGQAGPAIKCLAVVYSMMAPPSLCITRTQLQAIVASCPNVQNLILTACANESVVPNVPYHTMGELEYFKSLKNLHLYGVRMDADDLMVLLRKCVNVEYIYLDCTNMNILDDSYIMKLLSYGSLKKLKSFYAVKPLLTPVALKNLLSECPLLENIGKLSSWAIPRGDREKLINDIRQNNWNFTVDRMYSPLWYDCKYC